MSGERFDAVIVGAGPAGSVTALLLARAGWSVALLDRAVFPRAKACGDCISAGAMPLFRRLGVAGLIGGLPAAALRGWRIVAPGGAEMRASFAPDETALAIERARLDHALVAAATTAGAVLRERTHVVGLLRSVDGRVLGVRTRRDELSAPVTIGADGLRSVVARELGAVEGATLRKVSLTFHLDRPVLDESVGEMHVLDGRCVGIAPVAGNGTRTNVTVVADSGRFGRAVARDAAAFVRDTAGGIERLASALPRRLPHLLASGPFDRPVRRVAWPGAALVGDAAGYYDPFTGQGVFQATRSAELLAAALLAGPDTDTAGSRYARERAALMRGPRAVQRIIEAVLSRPRLADRAVARIGRADAFARALIEVTGDVEPPSSLLRADALRSLIIPSRLSEYAA